MSAMAIVRLRVQVEAATFKVLKFGGALKVLEPRQR
jgi:hypothetical protein